MNADSLSKTLADAVCDALNNDVPAEDCMKALRDAENKLGEFMLKDPAAHECMAPQSCTHH